MAYLHNAEVTAALDLGELFGWTGATVFVYGLANHGGDPSGFVGDAQGVDNIEAVDAFRLYEAWIQQNFLNGRLSLLSGLYDLNSEFDFIDAASVFINSSFGIGPDFALSRSSGPSIFPVTSFGARVRALPLDRVYLQTAMLDGVPGDPADPARTLIRFGPDDGLLLAAEIGAVVGVGDRAARAEQASGAFGEC